MSATINFDLPDELKRKLDSISESTGMSKTSLLTVGIFFVIFLANSGHLSMIQTAALTQNKPLLDFFQEYIIKMKI